MEIGWRVLAADLTVDVNALQVRQFVVVEFLAGTAPNPYAQVAREVDGRWYCEVVSGAYLPSHVWPLDPLALIVAGWRPPDQDTDNWWRTVDSGEDAAVALVAGLSLARSCHDPDAFVWSTGHWPPPDDDDEFAPVAPRGPFGLAA